MAYLNSGGEGGRNRHPSRGIQINLIIICNPHEFETTYPGCIAFCITQMPSANCHGLSRGITHFAIMNRRFLCIMTSRCNLRRDAVGAILHFHVAHSGQNLTVQRRETRTNTYVGAGIRSPWCRNCG